MPSTTAKRPTRKRSRSSASRRTSSRTQRDLDALLEQDPHEKRPTLKALALVGEGATKDVYRKGDTVYKYHVRRSKLTRFATPPDVLAKMQARLAALNAGNFEPDRGTGDVAACAQARRNGGFYGPWFDLS